MTDELRSLEDRRAIHEATLRYCRGVDRLDADLIRSAYHPDATDDHGAFAGSRDEVVDQLIERLGSRYVSTSHLIANQLIALDGDRAGVETYFVAIHHRDVDEDRGHATVWGRYLDVFERRLSEWRIAERVVVFDSSRYDPIVDPGTSARLSSAQRGRRDRADVSYRIPGGT